MLTSLSIKNIALITEIEIEFGAGLNVLTGETGAGKSIIIGGLNFIMGGRFDKTLIRDGANFARVTAVFDNDTVLARTLKTDGKNECRINGDICHMSELQQTASELLNIHGQHDTEILLKPKMHVTILDNFGGQKLHEVRDEYEKECEKMAELKRGIKNLGGDDFERKRLVDMYEYQIREIEAVRLRENEDIELTERRNRMQNFERLSSSLTNAANCFDGDGGIGTNMRQLSAALGQISHLDPRAEKFLETARSLKLELDDLGSAVGAYLGDLEFDPDELRRVDTRLDEIKILKRKYGSTTAEIFAFLRSARENLDTMANMEQNAGKLKNEILAQEKIVDTAGVKLVNTRADVAKDFEKQILKHLCDLGMPAAQFRVTEITTDGVVFLFSANAGVPPRPLVHIISGGEMSRVMLAIKTIASDKENVPTLIFDEIDTGISGSMGHKIAEKFTQICATNQIICVTHLAQIAAAANHHFQISKTETNGTTATNVKELDAPEIQKELKRMVGGDEMLKKLG
jgi:DNA repair protein RecN (Recombination protein N)